MVNKLILILLFATPVYAQQTNAQKTWDIASYATVGTQIGLDTIHNIRDDNRKILLIREGVNIGVTIGLSELIKHFVHEDRPDHSDMKSFWSEHTALAATTGGWNVSVGWSLTIGTGVGRVEANRHHPWDVLVGALVGTSVDYTTRHYIK